MAEGINATAVQAWNLMGGLDWSAIPIITEMWELDDPEMLIEMLVIVRNHMTAREQT